MTIKRVAKFATEGIIMGEKERSVSTAEDPGARRFSEYTPAGEADPGGGAPEPAEGKPSKEQSATAREVGSGMSTQRAPGGISHEDDWHDQARVAPADVDGDGVEDSIESTPGGVGRQTPKNDFGDRMQPGGGGGGGQQGIAIGDPGVNGNITPDPAAAAINSSHSNIKNLLDVDPGDGDADGDSTIVKSKSNITNNRTD